MIAGFFAPWIVYALVLLLHLALPARSLEGYARDAKTSQPLRYRLNGLLVFYVTLALWSFFCSRGTLPWDYLWTHRWSGLAGAITLGLLFSFAVVFTAPSTGKSALVDLFLGRAENPQWLGGRLDAKMWLYLVGATMLELNILSFAAHHWITFGPERSAGVLLYAGLFTFFLTEYLFFERVHLYTYDLFAERVGFKLGFGCLAFYPYFYCVGLWSVAAKPNPHSHSLLLALSAALFFSGWGLARGANMQKYTFKRNPTAKFLGFIEPEVVTDGERSLLCSGFWRISRHVNYLGEILMATGLCLSLGYPLDPYAWLYPLYYVALLFPRERDDDKRCAEKYGSLWDEYRQKVPYRIIPGVY